MTFIPGTNDRLEHSLSILDTTYSKNKSNRTILLDKLMNVIKTTEINPDTDKARDIEVKLQIFNTASALINDDDKQATTYTKINMVKQADDADVESSKQVIELLKGLHTSNTNDQFEASLPMDSCDLDIEEAYVDKGDDILETEMRTDSDDLS